MWPALWDQAMRTPSAASGRLPISRAVTIEREPPHVRPAAIRERYVGQSDGLGLAAAIRACNPGDRHRETRPEPCADPGGHGDRDLRADGAVGIEGALRDPEQLGLGRVRVGHDPTEEVAR